MTKEINQYIKDITFYYVNLEKDVLRKNNLEKHFKENDIKKYVRVDAIDKNSCIKHTDLSEAETACSLSHVKAINTFFSTSDEDFAIICEDDVDISNININNINMENLLITDKPLCIQLAVSVDNKLDIDFSIHKRMFVDYGTIAYLVNRKYAEKIVNTFLEDPRFTNFIPEYKIHPSGEKIKTIPVADELIYSLCETITYPIFTFFDYGSNIFINEERQSALTKSINQFKKYWNIL